MKFKKLLNVLVAALLAVMLLASCGSSDVSVMNDDSDNVSVSQNDKPKSDNKSDSDDKNDSDEKNDSDDEEKETEKPSTETETPVSVTPVPFGDNTISYDLTNTVTAFINGDTGDVITTVDKSAKDLGSFVEIEYGFAKYKLDGGKFAYADSAGNIFDLSDLLEYFPTMPDDASKDYPYVTNGVYIATADEKFYGLKSENGDVIIDAIYSSITPNKDFTYFICALNKKYSVISATGETKFTTNSSFDYIYLDFSPGFAYVYGDGLYNLSTGQNITSEGDEYIYQILPDSKFLTLETVIDENGNVLCSQDSLGFSRISALFYSDSELHHIAFAPYFIGTTGEEFSNNGNDKYFLIDNNGNKVSDIEIDDSNIYYNNSNGYLVECFYEGFNNLIKIYDSNMTLINSFDINKDYYLHYVYPQYGSNLIRTDKGFFFNYNGEIVAEYSEISDVINDNTIYYSDKNTGLWGVIQNGEIVIEPQYTKISGDKILKLEYGAEVTYILADNLLEIDMPAV